MSKDTIYIDVEDDITAIIGKVKAAKSKIVALVPPKRIGVLQSAVNLRLLARAADQSGKRLVLISGNTALTALAASAGIPAARTLQSKPQLAQVAVKADDDVEDIIDGIDLPVGDHAGIDSDDAPHVEPAIDSAIRASSAEAAAIVPPAPRPQAKSRRSSISVPNFDTFRKRLVLGVAGLALLIGFLVWAIWFAPHATIAITARTIESSANPKVTLATSATTDVKTGFLRSVQQEVKKDVSLEFDATGKKEVGEKATGTVKLSQQALSATSVPAGTELKTSGGLVFVTNAAASVPASSFGPGCFPTACPGSTTISVTAAKPGSNYNAATGALSGAPSGVSASFTGATSGGTDKTVAVVTAEDVEKAMGQLKNQDTSAVKKQLVDAFGTDAIVIDASFATKEDGVSSAPAVDEEAATGKAKLTGSLTFTMVGVAKSEAERFLDAYFAERLKESENQRVYSNGVDKTTFVDVVAIENGFTATMTATATFGPKIDDAAVRSQARGKKFGEVQSAIEGISGVESVDVKFRPFWVRTVPNDEERISIEFNLDEANE